MGTGASERSAAINASVVALVDAGIEMNGMITSVAVAFVRGEMRLDPSHEEEERASSNHVFAFAFGVGMGGTDGSCVLVESVGRFDEDEVRSPLLPDAFFPPSTSRYA